MFFHLHYSNILVLVMVSFTLFYNHFQLEYYVIAIFTVVCFYYSLFFLHLPPFSSNGVCLFSSFSFIIRLQNANKNTHHFITSIHLACITYLHLIYAFFHTVRVYFLVFSRFYLCRRGKSMVNVYSPCE